MQRQDLVLALHCKNLPTMCGNVGRGDLATICTDIINAARLHGRAQCIAHSDLGGHQASKDADEACKIIKSMSLHENEFEVKVTSVDDEFFRIDIARDDKDSSVYTNEPPQVKPEDAEIKPFNLDSALVELETRLINEALEVCGGKRLEVAKRLGISFRSLQYRMTKLGFADTYNDEDEDEDLEEGSKAGP